MPATSNIDWMFVIALAGTPKNATREVAQPPQAEASRIADLPAQALFVRRDGCYCAKKAHSSSAAASRPHPSSKRPRKPPSYRDNGSQTPVVEKPVRSVASQQSLNEEEVVRVWLLRKGYYIGKSWRPAGRADRAGSQQAAFSMELPSVEPLRDLLGQCEYHRRARYSIVNGAIQWTSFPTIDTYYISNEETLSDFLKLETRKLEGGDA
eukprot:6180485-Pleurochrysis_carterae.AAC.11